MESNLPEAVVFDLGKVLLDFDYGRAAAGMVDRCTLSLEALRRLIDQSPLLYRYETNLLTTAQFFGELQAASGFAGDLEEFRVIFGDIFTPIAPMVELHQKLRDRGFRTYIFSNTNEMAVNYIRKQYPFFREFDGYVLSCEHGAMKPAPSIYKVVEELTGCVGQQVLYIDDRAENVAAGLARGWRVIHHLTPEKTIAEIRDMGVL
jgi:glucose-1-phosphatase